MKLIELLDGIEYDIIAGDVSRDVSGLYYDSRKVGEGDVFVALKGEIQDGHLYISRAVFNGCAAVIGEFFEGVNLEAEQDVALIQVDDSRKALAKLSANYYGHPTRDIRLVGITGTNGKTSTSMYLRAIYEAAGQKVGVIGTTGVFIGDKRYEIPNTTPESTEVQRLISKMVEENIKCCIMEASSHALEKNRVDGCDFDTAVYTNLTPDHLELHGTMDAYYTSKARLFEMATGKKIINGDDYYGQKLIKLHMESAIVYGMSAIYDVFPTAIEATIEGSQYVLNTPAGNIDVTIRQPGTVNIYNSMAAAATALAEGIDLETISAGLAQLEAIKGRFETVYRDADIQVIVDFAHTEDGLQKALETLRPFVKNKLRLVFGVYAPEGQAGDDKRKGMATVAAQNADVIVATSDNPKFQDPVKILSDISNTLSALGASYKAILDREEAICYALDQMASGDILLIAGKGHETAQAIGGVDIPFNEREIVNRHMAKKK